MSFTLATFVATNLRNRNVNNCLRHHACTAEDACLSWAGLMRRILFRFMRTFICSIFRRWAALLFSFRFGTTTIGAAAVTVVPVVVPVVVSVTVVSVTVVSVTVVTVVSVL